MATGKSTKTITRKLSEPHVYIEHHQVKAKVGSVRTRFIDVATLGLPLVAEGHVPPLSCGGTEREDTLGGAERHGFLALPELENLGTAGELTEGSGGTRRLSLRSLRLDAPLTDDVQEMHLLLQPVLRTKKNSRERASAVESLAGKLGLHPRKVQRLVKALEVHGNTPYALNRKGRADKGKLRLPDEKRDLITAAFLNNKPGVSANAVYRALVRAVPEELAYVNGQGHIKRIEAHTVRAVQKELMDDPAMQLAFKDTTERKEFMRVYNGKVAALHANAQWQIDMTRCDTEVFNPVTEQFYRLRIQYVIDVYSGCIVGLSFSQDEDTVQVKTALIRALLAVGKIFHFPPPSPTCPPITSLAFGCSDIQTDPSCRSCKKPWDTLPHPAPLP